MNVLHYSYSKSLQTPIRYYRSCKPVLSQSRHAQFRNVNIIEYSNVVSDPKQNMLVKPKLKTKTFMNTFPYKSPTKSKICLFFLFYLSCRSSEV